MSMEIRKEIDWGGHTLSLSTNKLARQATGSVLVGYGDTRILCTVVASKDMGSDSSFFPLTVNYLEKSFANGKFPGGFNKREGKPTDRETLIARLIDRPLRPLFHPNFRNETQIMCTVLSFDPECPADIPSIIGASAALTVSGIPFFGPVAAARVIYRDGEFSINPQFKANDDFYTDLDLCIAGTRDGVLMVESEARELSEDVMLKALEFGHNAYQPVIDMIIALAEEGAKEPWDEPLDHPKKAYLEKYYTSAEMQALLTEAYCEKVKLQRYAKVNAILARAKTEIAEVDSEIPEWLIEEEFHEACSMHVRRKIIDQNIRIDGRAVDEIRPISTEISVLPRVHGSAVFNRGETQALGICTLGTIEDEQVVDTLDGEYKERFTLHYNFPPYSVGEVGRLGAPGRREIGHGKLAWRAIQPLLPSYADFPYSIRNVSEVLCCNGSSSMATVCVSSLALMDAGVPIKAPVAGIAMGLIQDGNNSVILSDIMADEDHLGDMDFKVTGTETGITALQMDIKVTSITFDILKRALEQARVGRKFILSKMSESISTAKELSPRAPRIQVINIPKDKIRDIIGPGGKVIKDIIDATSATIDIDDSGRVTVAAPNLKALEATIAYINGIAGDPEVGAIYTGKVVKITDFGAFVNFLGRDGLVHISELSKKRVDKVSDVVSEGQTVTVKLIGFDRGKPKLSIKAALVQEEGA